MVDEFRTVQADVLIVGAGGAGGRAAIEADKNSVSVIIVDKGLIGKAGTTPTAGGRALPRDLAAVELRKRESDKARIEARFKQVLQIGCYLNDQDLLWLWVNEAPELVEEIGGWTTRAQDSYSDALNNEIMRHPEISVFEYVIVTKLLTYGGRIVGATGLDMVSGEFILFKVKAVVLTCGGYGELFKPSECTPMDVRTGVTGDGQSLAYQAGCELVEMEMAQHQQLTDNPKWCKWGRHTYSGLPGVSLTSLESRGPFYDRNGKVCISEEECASMPVGCAPPRLGAYNPYLQKRVYEEMKKGPVYINLAERVKDISEVKLSLSNEMLHSKDFWDPVEFSKLRVVLGCIVGQGGPKINEKCETNVHGLYGAGEGCGSGNLYGAYRPSGSMDSILVFGRRAGHYAAEYAKTVKQGDVNLGEVAEERDRVYGFLEPKRNPVSPIDIKRKIWKITGEYLHVMRNEKGLKEAIKEIEEIRRKDLPNVQAVNIRRFNLEWMEAIEVPCMLDVAEMMARSALYRTESRGCHNREDYPQMDNRNWLCHTMLVKKDNEMKLSKAPVIMTRFKPPPLEECLKGGEPIPI